MTNLAAYRNHLDPADASAPVASSLAPSDPPVVITLRSSRLNNSTTDSSSAFIDIDPGSPPLIKNGDFEEDEPNPPSPPSSGKFIGDLRKWHVGEPSPAKLAWRAIGGEKAVSPTDPNIPGERANYLQWETQQQIANYTLPSRYDKTKTDKLKLNSYAELDAHWERKDANGTPIRGNTATDKKDAGKSDPSTESDHGIKQTVSLSRGNYLLLFDYRGRVGSDSNQFKVSAKGERAVDVETDLIAEKDASDPITGQSPTGLQKWKQGSVSFSVSGGNPADTAALPVILKFDLVLAPGKKADSFGVFIDNVILLPFELNSDLNNDGKVGEGSDSSLKTAGIEDSASAEAKEKGTEYMFVNDQLSNGAWDKEQSDPNKPATEINDDDAEELKTICGTTWGAVWFEYEGGDVTKLAFYKTKECTAAGKVTFPFVLSETNKLPEKLFVQAEPESGWTAQVEGKLVMKFGKADKSETYAADKLRLTVVKEIGNTKYFHAARDYMLEQNTRLHVRYFKAGSHEIRITAMRHESTDMKVIETYQPNPKIYGVPNVVAKSQDYYDLILNGNFCYFEGGLAGKIYGIQKHLMTSRCHGGCVVGGAASSASSEGGTSSFEQANAEYLSVNGKGTFAIATGVVPLTPPVHQAALGGFASNLVGGTYNIHPWFGLAEIGPTSDRKKLIFTVTQTAATTQYPLADLVARLTASGQTLCVAGDGGSSTAVAHRIEGDSTRVKFAGDKHHSSNDLGHYWINTYVGFKSDKPRP